MRKSVAWKMFLRAPLKAGLTFLLIAFASFAFLSRVTEYAVTSRETEKAESFYSGVAALDTSVPPIADYYVEPKPWPSEEQIEEFSSLPGVTLADTRYTTEGLAEDYKRIIDMDSPSEEGEFVAEGTYEGLEEYGDESCLRIYLKFEDVTVYAGEIEPDTRQPMRILIDEDFVDYYKSYSRAFFENLEAGRRFLVIGRYSEKTGTAFELNLYEYSPEESLYAIDELEEAYLDTEGFSWCKEKIEVINQSNQSYDIVYTSDMRAIPYVNEHRLVIAEGRPLTAADRETKVCVVSEQFLETYGLAVGDTFRIKLGDRLMERLGTGGAREISYENLSAFIASEELEIIGAYRFTDSGQERYYNNNAEWSYGPATIFVPSTLLPVDVPEDYKITMGDFSVFIENPGDVKAFREAAEPLAAEMGVGLRFSDGGWSERNDSFGTGPLASFLAVILYVIGAALALLLAVYLFINGNKNTYAVMRMLGTPAGKAGSTLAFPFCILAVFAMAAGGIAGLFYASYTVEKTLAKMSVDSAPEGFAYVLNAGLPNGVVIFCLIAEMVFTLSFLGLSLWKMKKTSPLELQQESNGRAGRNRKFFKTAEPETDIRSGVLVRPAIVKLSGVEDGQPPVHGKYNALRQTWGYILRRMRRGMGTTAVSLVLTVVLTAGMGALILTELAYRDAYRGLAVKGVAAGFSSSSVTELSKADLVKDFYYYTSNFNVRVNQSGILSPITFTNDFGRYLEDDYTVTWADGYDASVFERTGAVCLMGETLAEMLGVHPGDEITLLSDDLYSFMERLREDADFQFYKEEEDFLSAVEQAGKAYKVVGILHTEKEAVAAGVFSVVNDAAEELYGQPFQIGYCEFTAADNGKLKELNRLLEEEKSRNVRYAPLASFHIDSESVEGARRICTLIDELFPSAMVVALVIGLLGSGLVIMQSAREAACLRILGVTKKRARCMLIFGQVLLCAAAIALVTLGLALFGKTLFTRSIETLARCLALYFSGCVCGAVLAAIQVTGRKCLELLQIKG